MGKKMTMGKVLEAADRMRRTMRSEGYEVEIRRARGTARLSKIRPSLNQAQRPTKKLIDCLENGIPKTFDKNVEVEIVAWYWDGEPVKQSN